MKKLTRKSLSELAMMLPVVENEIQTSFVGGGAGTRTDPFTLWEWEEMGTSFTKGWVEFSSDTISYLKMDYYSYFSGNGYDDYYNDYYNDEGGTSLYNDTDTSNNNYFSYVNADEIARHIHPAAQNLYNQLKNSGKLVVRVIDIHNPPRNMPENHKRTKNAWVVMGSGMNYIYISHGTPTTEPWQYVNELEQELFHIYQDQLRIIDDIFDSNIEGYDEYGKQTHKYKSAVEFQENVMGWAKNGSCGGFLGGYSSQFDNWLSGVISDKTVNISAFLSGITQWYAPFIDNHTGNYAADTDKEYARKIWNMKWRKVFEWYGFTIQ